MAMWPAARRGYRQDSSEDVNRSFVVVGPRVWNSLPANLRDEDITYTSFRREIKTYWFSWADAQCDILLRRYTNLALLN